MKMLFCLLGLTIMGQSFADDPYRTAAYLHLAKTYLDLSNIRNAPMDCNRMYELNKSIAENKSINFLKP